MQDTFFIEKKKKRIALTKTSILRDFEIVTWKTQKCIQSMEKYGEMIRL